MGCIWVPTSFTLQTSAFGAALNVRKKKAISVSVQRRRSSKIIASSISPTQTDNNKNIPPKENTEFKSSFDEYLKAMESIRTDREKKKPKGSYNRKKHHNNGAVIENGPPGDVQSGEYFGFKGSAFKKDDDLPKEFHGDGIKGKKAVGIDPHNNAGLVKEVEFAKLKDGMRKKIVEGSARGVSSQVVRSNMSSNDEFKEIRTFPFEPLELIDDVQVGPRVSRMEMEERIQNLAKRLNDANTDMPEWIFSKMMRSAQIKFCDHSMMRIIKILGKHGNWKRVLQVVEWLQMHERYKSHKIRYVYTAALDVLGKTRRPVEALNLFCAMQRHKASYPDIVGYHSIAVTLGQAGHMKELFYVIDSMRFMPTNVNIEEASEDWDPRLDPDIVVYNAILNACAKRKEWEGAFWVLEKLAQVGQPPSSTTYGLVMEVMLACGKYDLVHEFFRQLQESFSPSALTYRVLVNTLWREGKPDEAMEAVYDMERRGLIGSASIYYDLARCLCSAGRCDEALMQIDKICKVASKPLVITYTGLIQACLDHGHINDGASVFNQMQKYCSPNVVTCNIMLKAYLRYGMFDEAKELFQKMTQDGHFSSAVKRRVIPDIHTFNVMIEACIKGERWNDFAYAYEQMLHHGYPFNTKRHLWMVLLASCAGKVEVVETTWKHLLQSNRIPPPALVKERFRLKMQNNETMAAISTIACHPSTHQQSFSKEAWFKLLHDNAHIFNKEAVEQVIHEVSVFLSKSEPQNLIFQNLRESCMEFVRVEKPTADTKRIDINESPCVHLTVV